MVALTGAHARSTFVRLGRDQSADRAARSRSSRDGAGTLGAQIEEQLRRRDPRRGAASPARAVPSTRDLARQLGVSRRVVVDAYAPARRRGLPQSCARAPGRACPTRRRDRRNGHAPRAAPRRRRRASTSARASPTSRPSRARPGCASLARRSRRCTDADLQLRRPGRRRQRCAPRSPTTSAGCAASSPSPTASSSRAATRRALALLCHALKTPARAASRSRTRATRSSARSPPRAGLEPVPIPVDEDGHRASTRSRPRASTPSSSPPPTSTRPASCSSRERRAALLALAARARRDRDRGRLRRRVPLRPRRGRRAPGPRARPGRLRRLGQQDARARRCGSAGSSSRRGCSSRVRAEKLLADLGTPRIDQHAFAHFLARGELDRHLRRMRARYRARRDALVEALAAELPEADGHRHRRRAARHRRARRPSTSARSATQAARRRIAFNTMRDYRPVTDGPAVLMLGYGQLAEPAIRAGVRELADAVTSARASTPPAAARPPRRPPRRSPPPA